MSTETKHSPLPWSFKSTADKSKFSEQWREIFDANGRSITQATDYQKSFMTFTGDREEVTVSGVWIKEQDAAHIVHCVNHYEALKEALEGMMDVWDGNTVGATEQMEIAKKSRALLTSLQA